MVLGSSGQISFSQIRTEMGGTGQVAMSSYYSNGATGARGVTGIPYTGAIQFSHFYGKTAIPVTSGLIAKYSGESWNGSTLIDETGAIYNSVATVGTINTGPNGLNGSKTYLYGNTSSGIRLPVGILPTTYTMFHIVRYNFGARQRIIDGVAGNFLSGFWNNTTGSAYHNGWITSYGTDRHLNTWVLSTDQNSYYASQQINRTTASGGTSQQIGINYGSSTEKSDWVFACLLVYNTTLSAGDILLMENYLRGIYGVPTVSYYNWYSAFTKVNSSFTLVQTGTDPDVEIQMNSSSIGASTTGLYISGQSLQNYSQVVVDFEVKIDNASADGISFYMGGTTYGIGEFGPTGSYSVGFQIFNGSKSPGIYLYDTTASTSSTGIARYGSTTLSTSSWIPVKIIYTKSTTNTWQILYNNTSVITYSDANNTSWLSSAGGYWGFGSRTGLSTGDYYVRRVSVSVAS